MALLQLAAALLTQPNTVPLPPPGLFAPSRLFEWAHVVRVSPRPNVVSGILMITTDFDVQVADGGRHRMTRTYVGPDQFIPPVGSICRIDFIPAKPYPGANIPGPNQVLRLDCDTGRDTEPAPGRGFLIQGVRIVGVRPPPRRHAPRALYAGLNVDAPGRMLSRLHMDLQGGDDGGPAIGSICAVIYDYKWVTGRSLGNPRLERQNVAVVDELVCGTLTAAD
jgi:hypothetical protein